MSTQHRTRYARASVIAIGSTAIFALALLTYADARRVLAERATADATTPHTDQPRAAGGLSAAQTARLARALRSTRIDGATIFYVDDDANTNGDGTSWPTAFNDLQDGLDAARDLAGAPAEVWVAAGSYKPDRGTGDREMSFELVSNTGIYGGFAGNEIDFNERDYRANETVLTGNLLGDDVGVSGYGENSYHVIYAYDIDDAVVDGCTVTAGNAHGGGYESLGGGLRFDRSSILCANCRILMNHGGYGAAVFAEDSDCFFVNMLFAGNESTYDGSVYSNRAGRAGGPTGTTFINCTMHGNTAVDDVGGIYSSWDSQLLVHNCILWENVGASGNGESAQILSDSSSAIIGHTCIQGWTGMLGGAGNTGGDPKFVDPAGGDYRLAIPSAAIDAGNNTALPGNVLTDLAGQSRFVDHPLVLDTGVSTNGLSIVDMGAFEWFDPDCNGNGVADLTDVAAGTSADVNSNGMPDECERDCNSNSFPDDYELSHGISTDCNSNGAPDECDIASQVCADCNANQVPDECEPDCDSSGFPDDCDVAASTAPDCNGNLLPDLCDIAAGTDTDCNTNSVPDVCDPDCNTNGYPDDCDIEVGLARDCNTNGVPDECDIAAGSTDDCNANGRPDECEVQPQIVLPTYPRVLNRNAATDWQQAQDWGVRVETDGAGTWLAAWTSLATLDSTLGNDRDILCARSTDNGSTWTYPQPLNINADADSGDDNSIQLLLDETGNWIAVWETEDDLGGIIGTNGEMVYARSADGGATWTWPIPLNAGCGSNYAQLAIDTLGNWIAVCSSTDDLGGTIGTDSDILFAVSANEGAAWTAPRALNSNAASDSGADTHPVLATTASGTSIVAWKSRETFGGATGLDDDILFARSADGWATWTAPAPLNANADDDEDWEHDQFPRLATDGHGNWIAAWVTNSELGGTIGYDYDFLYARSINDGVTWTYPAPLNTDADTDWRDDWNVRLLSDGYGTWVATWDADEYDSGPFGTDDEVFFTHSTDNGVTWTVPSPLNSNAATDSWFWDYGAALAVDDFGNWVAAWLSNNWFDDTIGYNDTDVLFAQFRLATDPDCNINSIPDECDLAGGTSEDCDTNSVPDECDTDCNSNGTPDTCDLATGASLDCNANAVPDECDIISGVSHDCNANGVPDTCDLAAGANPDCNLNAIPDECDIAADTSGDCDANDNPDECDPDCDFNGTPDTCELAAGTSDDCNTNGVPDNCEVVSAPINPTYPKALNTNATIDSHRDLFPQLATDGAGTWIAVWYSWDSLDGTIGSDGDILFSRSTDNGFTWSPPTPLHANAGSDSRGDHFPHAMTDGNGTWMVIWSSGRVVTGGFASDEDILISKSMDDGETWTTPAQLNASTPAELRTVMKPRLATNGDGRWVAVWSSYDDIAGTGEFDWEIPFSRSSDNGITWTTPTPLNANAESDLSQDQLPTVVSDRQDNWVAMWMSMDINGGTNGFNEDILFARSSDNGVTWTYPEQLVAGADTVPSRNSFSQMATDGDNWIAVWRSYDEYDGTIGTDADVLYARSEDAGETWTSPAPLNAFADVDTNGDFVPQLTADGNGNWVAVWVSNVDLHGSIGSDADILFARSTDIGATWTHPEPLNLNAFADSRFDAAPQLTADHRGNWIAVWDSFGGTGEPIGTDGDILFARFHLGTEPDCNLNGVPDECDADCDGDGLPDQCEAIGDMNHDGFVDADDIDGYLACQTQPCIGEQCLSALYLDECCAAADGDFDGDVDLHDFWHFQRLFNRVCYEDADCDGILDADDPCPHSPFGAPVNPFGGPMGDLDDDCLVTLDDYFFFEICLYLSGPNGNPGFQDCRDIFDFDGDADVDLADYAAFAQVLVGP